MKPEEIAELLAGTAHGSGLAVALLVQLLEQRGILEPGAYREALAALLDDPVTNLERLDRSVLNGIAAILDNNSEATG